MFRKINFLAATVVILWLGTIFTFAQNTTGHMSGIVTDPNGAVVQGATVKTTNVDTNLSRETTTAAGRASSPPSWR